MRKLSRLSLFAGLAAFGLAACGDDVTVVDPPADPLEVSVTPENVDIQPEETVTLSVSVSGGDTDVDYSVACTSSNSEVATAAEVDGNCQVTGVAGGNVTVTAEVTRGEDTESASAAVSVDDVVGVPEGQRASVSISAINQGGTPVDIDNVQGQVDVVLNVRPREETPQRVAVFVGDEDGENLVEAAAQSFADIAALAEGELEVEDVEGVAAYEVSEEGVEQITLSFRSNAWEVNEDGTAADPLFQNGDRTIAAELEVAEEDDEGSSSRAAEEWSVVFNNIDTYVVYDVELPENTARDNDNRLWYGGDSGDVEFTLLPLMYSGVELDEVAAELEECGSASTDDAPFRFEFSCGGVEHDSVRVDNVTSVTADGNTGPSRDREQLLNRDPFPVRIDNEAPTGVELTIGDYNQNYGNWVNHEYPFSAGFDDDDVADGGVGIGDDWFAFFVTEGTDSDADPVLGPDADLTAAGLEETVTSDEYRVHVTIEDRLGNSTVVSQAGDEDLHPKNTFGYDETPPSLDFSEEEGTVGQLVERYNTINLWDDSDDRVFFRGEDNAAGFAPGGTGRALDHAYVWMRGRWEEPNNPETSALVGSDATGSPFGTVRDGAPIADLVTPDQAQDAIDRTAVQFTFDPTDKWEDLPQEAGYYIYQVQLRDRAGNLTRDYRAVYLNNCGPGNGVEIGADYTLHGATCPEIDAFSAESFGDEQGSFSFTATDSVEVMETSFHLTYDLNDEVRIIWDRENADVESYFRGPSYLPQGEGNVFTDVIHRPLHTEEQFGNFWRTLAQADNGTPPSEGGVAPDSITLRVYNGWAYDEAQEDLNHLSGMTGGAGAHGVGYSAWERQRIQPEQVQSGEVSDWLGDVWNPEETGEHGDQWILAEDGEHDCESALCAQAVGPTGEFEQPFHSVFIAEWFAVDEGGDILAMPEGDLATVLADSHLDVFYRVIGEAEANFNSPFPTRDEGEQQGRLYEWTFDQNPEDKELVAIGVRDGGDALATTLTGPETVFSIRFDPDPLELTIPDEEEPNNGESVAFSGHEDTGTMQVVHDGPFSTGDDGTTDGITVESCELPDNPIGVSVEVNAGEDGCLVSVNENAAPGEYTVEADATDDQNNSASVSGTVIVEEADFEISLVPDEETATIPGTGSDSEYFEVQATGADVGVLECSVTPDSDGEVTVSEDGTDGCIVTFTSDADPGDYTVSAQAREADGDREDSATATLTLEEFDIGASVDPESQVIERGETEFYDVSATETIDDLTCGDPGNDLTATEDGTNGCNVEVDAEFDREGGDFPFTITVVSGDHEQELTAVVEVPEVGEFDPTFEDIEGLEEDDRRELERDRTAQWRVVDGEGFGVDVTSSTAEVTPTGQGVTAAVATDGDEVFVEADVTATADTGTYEIHVTFVEEGTGEEEERTLYIRVIDTGADDPPAGL